MQHENPLLDLQSKLFSFLGLSDQYCRTCKYPVGHHYSFRSAPPILGFDLENCKCIINPELQISNYRYQLCGIVDYANHHFTSCVIQNDNIWFHDGFQPAMYIQGCVTDQQELYNWNGQVAAAAIYELII